MTVALLDWETARDRALSVRYAVFVQEQGVPIELEQDEHDASSVHALALTSTDQVLGTGRLLMDGHIGRMAVAKHARGRGVGGRILQSLMNHATALGYARVVLCAQCHAQAFYAGHGFVASGPVFKDAGIDHVLMTKEFPAVD